MVGISDTNEGWTDTLRVARRGVGQHVPAAAAAPGRYLTPPGSVGTFQSPNGELRMAPLDIDRRCTVDRLGISVQAAGSLGAVIRLGIYADDDDGRPTDLVLDAGTVAADAAGNKEVVISQLLDPGRYWLAAVVQGAPATLPTWHTVYVGGVPLSLTAAPGGGSHSGMQATGAHTAALPASVTDTFGAGAAARVWLRVAP